LRLAQKFENPSKNGVVGIDLRNYVVNTERIMGAVASIPQI